MLRHEIRLKQKSVLIDQAINALIRIYKWDRDFRAKQLNFEFGAGSLDDMQETAIIDLDLNMQVIENLLCQVIELAEFGTTIQIIRECH